MTYKHVKSYRERRKAEGKCIACGTPSERTRCPDCRKKCAELQRISVRRKHESQGS